jgi:hypothetical protein
LFIVELVIFLEELKQMCLKEIDEFLHPDGKWLADFDCMPQVASSASYDNLLLVNELSYGHAEMLLKHDHYFSTLNPEQLSAYQQIVCAVEGDLGSMFFVDGYGWLWLCST